MLPTNAILYWGAAVALVLAAATLEAQRARIDVWTMYLAGIAGVGGALLVGAAGVIGALAGAALFGWLVVRVRAGDFLRYADAAVPGIALGYAVYRVGCFVNGCCFGVPADVPWGVTFEPGTEAYSAHVAAGWIEKTAPHSLAVHPTQLYHAAAGALSFLALASIRDAWPGSRLAAALLAYGASRFAIEFFRGDSVPVWWLLDWNHLMCIAMIAIGMWQLWKGSSRSRSEQPGSQGG